jgi:hypothetical protein
VPRGYSASIAILAAILLTVSAAASAGCGVAHPNASVTAEQQLQAAAPDLRAAVTGFVAQLESFRPPKLYGKELTAVHSVSFMKGRDAALEGVSGGDAFAQARSGWSTLAGLVRQEQELARSYGPGTEATGCHGDIGYWQVLSGGGDRYVVRAAVLVTLDHGRWDSARHELTDTGSFQYSDSMAWDYTLQRIDGVWKVVAQRFTGLSFTRGGSGLHPDSA